MRKGNDEIYQLAKEQALVKKLKNKRFYIYNVALVKKLKNKRFYIYNVYKTFFIPSI
jgi:hypothetical protein